MQINQLKYLVAVEQYGSISKAAQELYISQSNVSLALINLEEELGSSLLIRGKRGVTFTPVGKQILIHAHNVLDEIDSIQLAAAGKQEVSGDVHIAGTTHYAMNILTDTMIQCRNQFPDLHVYAHYGNYRNVIKSLAQKELDLGFISYYNVDVNSIESELQRYLLEMHILLKDRSLICVTPDHPLYGREHLSVHDLQSFPWVTGQSAISQGRLKELLAKTFQGETVAIADIANIRKYAAKTNGFLIMPESEIENSNCTYNNQFVPLPVEDYDLTMVTGWVHHNNHELTPAEHKLVELLAINCRKYQEPQHK